MVSHAGLGSEMFGAARFSLECIMLLILLKYSSESSLSLSEKASASSNAREIAKRLQYIPQAERPLPDYQASTFYPPWLGRQMVIAERGRRNEQRKRQKVPGWWGRRSVIEENDERQEKKGYRWQG